MKKIFYSKDEGRLRAGIRILVFTSIVLVAIAVIGTFAESRVVFTAFLAGLMLLMIKFSSKFLDRRPYREYGMKLSPNWWRDFFAGIVIAALAITIIYGILVYMGWVTTTGNHKAGSSEVLKGLFLMAFLMICVSLWEEIYFRGYLIPNIKEGFHSRKIDKSVAMLIAVLISSVLFGFGHITNPGATGVSTLNLIVAGMVLAYPYVVTGSLALPVGIHLSWNYFQGAIYGLPVSGMEFSQTILFSDLTGPEAFTGGAFGPEAGAAGLFGLMVLVTLSEIYMTRFYKK